MPTSAIDLCQFLGRRWPTLIVRLHPSEWRSLPTRRTLGALGVGAVPLCQRLHLGHEIDDQMRRIERWLNDQARASAARIKSTAFGEKTSELKCVHLTRQIMSSPSTGRKENE